MVKSSFTLLETLISITFLLIVISGFKYSSYYDENNHLNFMLLNDLENKFNTKDYSNLTRINQNIQIIKNKETIENIDVLKYEYYDNNIKIYTYEK